MKGKPPPGFKGHLADWLQLPLEETIRIREKSKRCMESSQVLRAESEKVKNKNSSNCFFTLTTKK